MLVTSIIAIFMGWLVQITSDTPCHEFVVLCGVSGRNLNIDCSVLMGPNIASEVGDEYLAEGTIGYNSQQNAEILQLLFQTPYFHVSLVNDVVSVTKAFILEW